MYIIIMIVLFVIANAFLIGGAFAGSKPTFICGILWNVICLEGLILKITDAVPAILV